MIQLLQNNIPLSRIEFLDQLSIAAANEYSKVGLPAKPSLFLEISGNQADIGPVVRTTREIIEENGGSGFQHSSKTEERSKLWKARHELYYACKSTRPGHRTIITDVCVPISRLTDIILQMQTYFEQYNINGECLKRFINLANPVFPCFFSGFSFGHVGDGNFHSVITYDEADPSEVDRVFTVTQKIAEDAIRLGGTCTGEHGVGRGKMELLRNQFDDTSIEVMHRIKKALDPKNLINAGKVIPPLRR